jgi:hypothetical protein
MSHWRMNKIINARKADNRPVDFSTATFKLTRLGRTLSRTRVHLVAVYSSMKSLQS